MVTETLGLEDEVEVEDFDASGDDATDELDTDPNPEPSKAEPDPLAEIREQLGPITQQLGRFADFDPQAIRRDIGHIRALQSKVDSLASADPLKAIDPRVANTEEVLESLVEALTGSDLLDDASKTSLRSVQTRLAQAKTKQEREQWEAEVLSKVASATQTVEQKEEEPQPARSSGAVAATSKVEGYAEAKGVDPTTIPKAAWALLPGEDLDQAVVRVKGIVDSLAAGDSAATRTATRREAAGNGSPSRAGGASQNDMERYNAYGAGEIEIPEKELRALEARLKAKGEL